MFETISFSSTWLLHPDPAGLIRGLAELGYATARVKPRLEGYDIDVLEPPNVIAVKGANKIKYDFS